MIAVLIVAQMTILRSDTQSDGHDRVQFLDSKLERPSEQVVPEWWNASTGVSDRNRDRMREAIEALNVGDVTGTDPGTLVIIVDAPVDDRHAMLRGLVVDHRCISDSCAPPRESCERIGCQHGTAMASLIGGRVVKGAGGVAPETTMISLDVVSPRVCGDRMCDRVSVEDLDRALEVIHDIAHGRVGSTIANVSLSGGAFTSPCDDQFPQAAANVRRLLGRGVIVVAAAGNGGRRGAVGYPACLSEVISVSAVVDGDGTAALSRLPSANYDPSVDIVVASESLGAAGASGSYVSVGGTFSAAALVSGTLALRPADTDARTWLRANARCSQPLATYKGYVCILGRGMAVGAAKSANHAPAGSGALDVPNALAEPHP